MNKSILCTLWVACFCNCIFYSFSGSSVSGTISIQDFQAAVSAGPPDLDKRFTETLVNTALDMNQLSPVDNNGDYQLEGVITGFDYRSIIPISSDDEQDPTEKQRLTITIQVTFENKFDPKANFTKQSFSEFADVDANSNITAEEPKLVQEIFDKLVDKILTASVNKW